MRVPSSRQLINTAWGPGVFMEDRTVDVHIRQLLRALRTRDNKPDLIRTVRSFGCAPDSDKA